MARKIFQSEVVLEEWNGSSSSELRKTAILSASPSLLIQRHCSDSPSLLDSTHRVWNFLLIFPFPVSIYRSGSRFRLVGRRFFDAFVPEASLCLDFYDSRQSTFVCLFAFLIINLSFNCRGFLVV